MGLVATPSMMLFQVATRLDRGGMHGGISSRCSNVTSHTWDQRSTLIAGLYAVEERAKALSLSAEQRFGNAPAGTCIKRHAPLQNSIYRSS